MFDRGPVILDEEYAASRVLSQRVLAQSCAWLSWGTIAINPNGVNQDTFWEFPFIADGKWL